MKKIVLTGPESTGKTTLAKKLAEHFKTLWNPEYARIYINQLNRSYQKEDLLQIAKQQLIEEEKKIDQANQLLFCDTDLITLKIWSEYKYNFCHPWILQQIKNRKYDLYFLCGTDVKWEDDPQRENPNDRTKLYDIYKTELTKMDCKSVELIGNKKERFNIALEKIRLILPMDNLIL